MATPTSRWRKPYISLMYKKKRLELNARIHRFQRPALRGSRRDCMKQMTNIPDSEKGIFSPYVPMGQCTFPSCFSAYYKVAYIEYIRP